MHENPIEPVHESSWANKGGSTVSAIQSYKSVLLVDDDPTQIAILTAYFVGQNVTTIMSAKDASEALTTLAQHLDSVDLVVTDLQMPNMDGVEFLRHLKTLGYDKNMAIVSCLSRDIIDHTAHLAKMHGLNIIGCIKKPLTRKLLDAVFQKQLEEISALAPLKDQSFTLVEFTGAMRAGEIIPHYQPKIDLRSGKVVGAEALARWPRDNATPVSPVVFIDYAEKNGMIEELTFRLFESVLIDLKRILAIDPGQKIAVNLSPIMMPNIKLPDQIDQLMKEVGIRPANISFEVTESSVLDLDTNTLEVLSRLRISGFDVAIDDFGTGSANIQTLKNFPYSELKIDQSFIKNVTTNKFSSETVRVSIALARQMDMKIVAEGVHNDDILQFVRASGIEQAQGFHLAKPMSAQDFSRLLSHGNGLIDVSSSSSAA